MKRLIYIFALCLFSCSGFKDAVLTQEEPLIQTDSTEAFSPALAIENFNKGIFYNSTSDISKWEVSHRNVVLQKKKGALMTNLQDAGVDWEFISLKFQPLDFSKMPNLIIKAKSEGKEKPTVRIDLYDEAGNFTNFVPQQKTISNDTAYHEYLFVFDGNWIQNWPFRANVNKSRIVEIKINVNGGGPNYSGRIFIEEIKAESTHL